MAPKLHKSLHRGATGRLGAGKGHIALSMTTKFSTNSNAPVVLIIEDEHSFREALEMAISDEGYCVVSATNGEEALLVLEHMQPDLILMDVHMPVMDGIEFLNVYRFKYVNHVPIIVCSTRSQKTEFDVTGVAAFMSKPVDIDDLLRTVHSHVKVAP